MTPVMHPHMLAIASYHWHAVPAYVARRFAATRAAIRSWVRRRVAIHPMDNDGLECAAFGRGPVKLPVEFGNGRSFLVVVPLVC